MPSPEHRYKRHVLDGLWRHGVQPTGRTRPELVHEFVSDLYRYELRRLRNRLVAGSIPKDGYYGRVVALRRQYPLISMRPAEWIESSPPESAAAAEAVP